MNQFLSSHQASTLMSCLYNFRWAVGSPLQTVLSSSSSYKLVDDKHPRLAVTLDPGPDTRSPGPVAIHCAAGSPFVTVSQLTSPPEHPQFSVSPHEKIHGNLKTQPHFFTTVIIEESKEPKLSFRPSLLNCFPMEYNMLLISQKH